MSTCDSLSTAVAPARLVDPILDKPAHDVTQIRTYIQPSVALRGLLRTAMHRVGTSSKRSLSPIPPSVRYPGDARCARRLKGPHRAFYIATPVPGASASKQIFYANLSHPPIYYGAAGEIMYVNRKDIPRHPVGHRRDYHWIVMDAAGKSTGLKLGWGTYWEVKSGPMTGMLISNRDLEEITVLERGSILPSPG